MSAEFSDNAQTYREAIAGAAGTVPENVVVVSNGLIDETGGPAGFEVQYKILASNVVGISELTSRLGTGDHLKANIETELAAQNLDVSTNVNDPLVACSAETFTTALALAANTHPANVVIKKSIEGDGTIEVRYKILASDEAGVTALINTMGTGDALKAVIDDELAALSLRESTAVTPPITGGGCDVGHTGSDGDCTKCAWGWYKGEIGDSPCLKCPTGKYSTMGASKCGKRCGKAHVGPFGTLPRASVCIT